MIEFFKQNPAKILPILLIVIMASASVVCFATGDAKKGLYWLFSAAINTTVTL